jgi:hypothetical protein
MLKLLIETLLMHISPHWSIISGVYPSLDAKKSAKTYMSRVALNIIFHGGLSESISWPNRNGRFGNSEKCNWKEF